MYISSNTHSIVVNFSSGGNVTVKTFKILSSIFHPSNENISRLKLCYKNKITQGFLYVFVQEVCGVLQPGIFSFSYERK